MNTRPVPITPKLRQKPTDTWLARAIADRTILVRILVVLLIGETALLAVQPFAIIQQLHQRERVVVLDSNGPTYTITPLLSFEEATALHESVAMDATAALLNRGPNGLDREDIMKMIFLEKAREKVATLVENESPEIRAKGFHQKVEAACGKSTTTENTVVINVTGQIIRTGVFNGRVLVETKHFDLQLTLLRNPNMLVNKRYPLSVWNFDLKYL